MRRARGISTDIHMAIRPMSLSLSMDVGVDTHDSRPWHFDEIQSVTKSKAAARESNTRAERSGGSYRIGRVRPGNRHLSTPSGGSRIRRNERLLFSYSRHREGGQGPRSACAEFSVDPRANRSLTVSRMSGTDQFRNHGKSAKSSRGETESARANFTMFSRATFRSPRSTPPT
jgi:hypothetical protein